MDVLGAGQVELNLFRTQSDLQRQVNMLASGLRVNSASDDPSGLSIAETIHSKVSGLQQGVQDAQLANTMLATADGVLNSVQLILTRIHTLIVSAASDINSDSQLQSIQSEIDQLLVEVNHISSNAQFNGLKLFDGSLDGTSGLITQGYAQEIHPSLNVDGSTALTGSVANGADPVNDPSNLLFFGINGTQMYQGGTGYTPGLTELQVIGYSNNAVDPFLGPIGGPGVYVRGTQYSTDASFSGANGAQEMQYTQALPAGTGANEPVTLQNANNTTTMLYGGLANLSAQDVGVAIAYETYDPTNATGTPTGHAIQVNTQGTEGGTVSINLPSINTRVLDVSGISVLRPQVVGSPVNAVTGTDSNQFAVMDAQARVNHAIDLISSVRAKVGAQSVALSEDMDDGNTGIVNQTASESAIRDLNIGQAVSALTKDQVLSQIGLSVLSQLQINAQLVTQLVTRSAA